MQVSRNYTDVFLAHWVTSQSAGGFDNATVSKYLSIYGGIAAVNAVFSFLRSFLFAYGGICAARILHQRLLGVVLKAKTWFFDTTPLGKYKDSSVNTVSINTVLDLTRFFSFNINTVSSI